MKYIFIGALIVVVILAILLGSGRETTKTQRTLDEEISLGPEIEASFEHVAPGEYTEVYISVATEPNHDVTVHLGNSGGDYSNEKTETSDENGVALFVFRVFKYDIYTHNVEIEAAGVSYAGSITVE